MSGVGNVSEQCQTKDESCEDSKGLKDQSKCCDGFNCTGKQQGCTRKGCPDDSDCNNCWEFTCQPEDTQGTDIFQFITYKHHFNQGQKYFFSKHIWVTRVFLIRQSMKYEYTFISSSF